MSADYETLHGEVLTAFKAQWTTRQPTWSQTTRVQWPDGDPPAHGRQQWIRLALTDVDGFDSAIGIADVVIGLFTVDLFTPLPELATNQHNIIKLDLRNAMRAVLPAALRPVRFWTRDFGRNPDGFKHSRAALAFHFDLPDPS